MIWRWRSDSETMSSSTTPSVPTPAAARYISAGAPRPPAPITSTEASFKVAWPGPPTSRSTIWRGDRSSSFALSIARIIPFSSPPPPPFPTPPCGGRLPPAPGARAPADTANAMPQAERQAIQSDLAWVGEYNGAISGEVSERMVAAIKEFQKAKGGKQTGVLNPQERGALAETAKRRQENVGWKIVTQAGTGAPLGIPTKLVPQQSSDPNGPKWSSSTGTIQIQLSRPKEANPTTAKLAEQEKKEPAGRKVEYAVVKPDFFVLSGMQGLRKFYVRGQYRGDEIRILTILYDQATEGTVEPVVIAMSSASNRSRQARRSRARRRARPWNTGPALSSATTALSLRTVRLSTAALRLRLPATAMPIASPRTRTTVSLCCAFTARTG